MYQMAFPPKHRGIESLITETQSCWDRLRVETRPIYIYGMGDGAVKIMTVFRHYGIKIAGIFASDDFVRGHSFAGFKVEKLSEVEEKHRDFVIVLAFAAGYPSLYEWILTLSKKHTLYVPDVPVIGGGLFTYDYCMEHLAELNAVYHSLADDESRRVFLNIIQYKISGRVEYLEQTVATSDQIYKQILKPSRTESFVDLGAYKGDSIQELLSYTNQSYFSIVAVEPDSKNFRRLKAYIEQSQRKRVALYHCAAWCKDSEIPFATKAGRQSSFAKTGTPLPVRSVDSLLDGGCVTLLKMDVEGFEREALWGAANTIRLYHPKLSVALYHRNEDLFELPLLVKRLNPNYKLYIRHKMYIPAWETLLFAINEEGKA